MNKQTSSKRNSAFTVLEISIALVILLVLVGIAVPVYHSFQSSEVRHEEQVHSANVSSINATFDKLVTQSNVANKSELANIKADRHAALAVEDARHEGEVAKLAAAREIRRNDAKVAVASKNASEASVHATQVQKAPIKQEPAVKPPISTITVDPVD